MTTYSKEEILPSSLIARKFGDVLNKLKNNKLKKVAIIRNNQLEAVILPVLEFEELNEKAEMSEHIEIYNITKKRELDGLDNAISFEDILEEYQVNENEL
jgi:PHD/YefM family antitoxin component YafN of YafNO toxin-antitoxin module